MDLIFILNDIGTMIQVHSAGLVSIFVRMMLETYTENNRLQGKGHNEIRARFRVELSRVVAFYSEEQLSTDYLS